MTRTVAKGPDTRTRIMDIAQDAILQKGFDATSIEEIVAAAEITKGGFFYHFPDKNALARALFFNQLGELRDRRFENQTYRASGLNLLVAAIILWNTRYLEMALADIGTADEIARHIAPLGWEHISLTGDYSWNVEDQPDPDALRPLRAVNSLLAA